MNLKNIRDNLLPRHTVLKEDDVSDIKSKIDNLLDEIEQKVKMLWWNMQAKIGTRQKWY